MTWLSRDQNHHSPLILFLYYLWLIIHVGVLNVNLYLKKRSLIDYLIKKIKIK